MKIDLSPLDPVKAHANGSTNPFAAADSGSFDGPLRVIGKGI